MKKFILIFFLIAFSFVNGQNDSILKEVENVYFGSKPKLLYSTNSKLFYLVNGIGNRNVGINNNINPQTNSPSYAGSAIGKSSMAFYDNELNRKFYGNAKFIDNTKKVLYENNLLFIKYKTYNNNFGYYLTAILNEKGVTDTSLTIMEYNFYDERKFADKKNFRVRIKALASPNNNSIAFIYDNNYKKGVNEGYKLRILKNNNLLDEIDVQFQYPDEKTKLGNFYFDGKNIYTFVYIYHKFHSSKVYPIKYAIVKYNTITKDISQKEFNFNSTTLKNLDLSGYNDDVFVLNSCADLKDKRFEIKKVKLLRINNDLEIEDSIIVDNKTLSQLNFDKGLKSKELKKWRVENKILPQVDNSFPDYQLNYYFTKSGIAFDGSPGVFDKHAIKPEYNLLGNPRGISSESEYHYTCNNLIMNSNGVLTTFNDTIYGTGYSLIEYAMIKENNNLYLYSNIRDGQEKGYRQYLITNKTLKKDVFTDWIYCFGQLIYNKENQFKTIPVTIKSKPFLFQYK